MEKYVFEMDDIKDYVSGLKFKKSVYGPREDAVFSAMQQLSELYRKKIDDCRVAYEALEAQNSNLEKELDAIRAKLEVAQMNAREAALEDEEYYQKAEQVSKVISSIESIRDSIIANAEAEARQTIGSARAEAEETLGAARGEAARILEEAETAANLLPSEAEAQASQKLADAQAEADRILNEALEEKQIQERARAESVSQLEATRTEAISNLEAAQRTIREVTAGLTALEAGIAKRLATEHSDTQ